jgi:hypothetical protein
MPKLVVLYQQAVEPGGCRYRVICNTGRNKGQALENGLAIRTLLSALYLIRSQTELKIKQAHFSLTDSFLLKCLPAKTSVLSAFIPALRKTVALNLAILVLISICVSSVRTGINVFTVVSSFIWCHRQLHIYLELKGANRVTRGMANLTGTPGHIVGNHQML